MPTEIRTPRLRATSYNALQTFVHRGHHETVQKLVDLMEAHPGETVVEIGCGTGMLARRFVERGYDYWGVDPDEQRIEAARTLTRGHFITGDAWALPSADIPAGRHVFIHGVLHHLDDAYCVRLIDFLLDWAGGNEIVASEPVRPDHWWLNPAGALAAALDHGKHVRRMIEWLSLFGEALDHASLRRLWPRWPVSMLDVRLRKPGNRGRGPVHAAPRAGSE